MSKSNKWIVIFIKYGIVGFVIGEIIVRIVWKSFIGSMNKEFVSEKLDIINELFSLHYFLTAFILILAGTLGLAINLLRESNLKSTKQG